MAYSKAASIAAKLLRKEAEGMRRRCRNRTERSEDHMLEQWLLLNEGRVAFN